MTKFNVYAYHSELVDVDISVDFAMLSDALALGRALAGLPLWHARIAEEFHSPTGEVRTMAFFTPENSWERRELAGA